MCSVFVRSAANQNGLGPCLFLERPADDSDSSCRIPSQETVARAVGLRLRERPWEYFFLQNLFF